MVSLEEFEAANRLYEYNLAHAVHAVSAKYCVEDENFEISLDNGMNISLPRQKIQGLSDATTQQLLDIKIIGDGEGLHFPLLDEDISVPSLMLGVFGNKAWMEQLNKAKVKPSRQHSQSHENHAL